MASIADAEVARLRSKLGSKVDIAEPPYLTEVTRDAIRHWAWATGDRNPLYVDEAHARHSRYGSLIAPPAMLYAFSRMSIGYRGGLPGVHAMFGGTWWRWHQPIRLGSVISTEVIFKDLIEMPSKFAGRMFKQLSLVRYHDQQGSLLAEADAWGMRVGRSEAREKGKYQPLEQARPHYTPERMTELAELYRREVPRGDKPLWWDEIEVGAELPGIVRGPYTPTVAIAFEQAWGGLFIWAHGYWSEYLKRHPAAGLPNAYGIPEPPEAVHWDSTLARSVGVPEAYDYGPERIAWVATMLTNWIGDDGFLSELHCEVRRFNLVGDTTFCRGRVVEKTAGEREGGALRVNVEALDQRGESTAKGWAKVLLPKGVS
jgi:acyl dehydratase